MVEEKGKTLIVPALCLALLGCCFAVVSGVWQGSTVEKNELLGVKAEAETGSTRTIQIRFQTGLLKPVSYKAG